MVAFSEQKETITHRPEPVSGSLLGIRLLIVSGLCFMLWFAWVYLQPENIGHPVLYWLLTTAVLFKLLRMLHEWYHYWSVKPPVEPSVTRTWQVDVFTTFCPGEPYEMIVNTLKAIQHIQYPHTTYLCDEANDPYLIEVCRELGVRHVTRTVKKHAKAGNINNALRQATGEICLILDPDHVPAPDFLDRVLPYFENPSVGFVQVVQAYYNRKESLVAYGAAEQTYHFYGPMMTCMGTYGTAQAIGANCTFRRSALDSIGGHAPGLSEDMHTSMRLHAKGWQSVYVPLPLSKGLVPGTMAAYYKQQIKWARGTFELLFVTYPQLFRHFTWRQKIHYFTAPLYYLFGVIGLVEIIIPVLSLLLMELPIRMHLLSFLTLFLPMYLISLLIRQYAQRWLIERHEPGFHLIGGILRNGTWWIYVLGLVYTIFRVPVPYIPTPKNDQPKNNLLLCLPNLLACLITLGCLAYTTWFYGRMVVNNLYFQLMAGFALLNATILGFNVLIGQEKFLSGLYRRVRQTSFHELHLAPLRLSFWRTRHRVYRRLQRYSVHFSVGILLLTSVFFSWQAVAGFFNRTPASLKWGNTQGLYWGVFLPDPSPSVPAVEQFESFSEHRAGIVAFQQRWHRAFPRHLADSLARRKSVPLLVWEPGNQRGVMAAIRQGMADDYLNRFAQQVRQFGKPVFMVFAPEADNPRSSFSFTNGNTADDQREAWRHVVDIFRQNRAENAIWVWNPWNVTAFGYNYPGSSYVDWIAVNGVNDHHASADGEWHSFESLYQPYKSQRIFHLDDSLQLKPVMVLGLGTTGIEGDRASWFNDALLSIQDNYPEIKSVLFYQHNRPAAQTGRSVDFLEPAVGNWPPADSVKVKAAIQKSAPALFRRNPAFRME